MIGFDLSSSPAVLRHFDSICGRIARLGRGLTLQELGIAHCLARELEADAPDPAKVEQLERELGVQVQTSAQSDINEKGGRGRILPRLAERPAASSPAPDRLCRFTQTPEG